MGNEWKRCGGTADPATGRCSRCGCLTDSTGTCYSYVPDPGAFAREMEAARPIRVAHCIQPDEPDHACRGCGEELELRHGGDPLWIYRLVCTCGTAHIWSAEGGYGDDGSGWRWWVTGTVKEDASHD